MSSSTILPDYMYFILTPNQVVVLDVKLVWKFEFLVWTGQVVVHLYSDRWDNIHLSCIMRKLTLNGLCGFSSPFPLLSKQKCIIGARKRIYLTVSGEQRNKLGEFTMV